MAGESQKERALLNTEKLKDEADLKQLAEQLNKLIESDEGKKKLTKNLDKQVSEILSNVGIVDSIQKIYRSQEGQDRSGLERLMKLANVDEGVKDEQREINVRLEAIKEQASLSEEVRSDTDKLRETVLSNLENKIVKLISEGDFQGALDNVVFLLSDKDKEKSFQIVKNILKKAPSNTTLYIKDKKISYSQRKEWIKKMEDNIENAAREFQVSYYSDTTVSGADEWTLDETKSGKKYSEKKASRKLDEELSGNKELSKLMKRLNKPSAFKFVETNFDKIQQIFNETRKDKDSDAAEKAFNEQLTKQFFIENGYVPKSGEDLKTSKKYEDLPNKEWRALRDLCLYRLGVKLDDSEATDGDNKKSGRKSYETLSQASIAGISMSELSQATDVLNNIKIDNTGKLEGGAEPKNVLMTLLGDLNWDGKVTNTSIEEGKKREGLDKGTVFGGQMASMFDGAIKRFGEEQVIKNVESIVKSLNGLVKFEVNPKTITGLIAAFKNNPSALISFRNKLVNEPDSGMSMFNTGTEYVNRKIDRLKNEEQFRKSLEEFFETQEGKEATEALNQQLDSVLEKELEEKVLPNLKKYKESAVFKKLSDGQKQKIDTVINQLSTDEGRKEFLASPAVKDMYKNFIISGIGLNFSDISVDGKHIYGIGAGASISNEKFNAWLSNATKNIINKASASVGLYCADGNVSLGVGLGFGASKNLGENARVFYNVGSSWSPFNPRGLSFNAVVGEETRVNPKADNSLDLKASHYIGVAGAYGVGLNLSDSNFNTDNISVSTYWRKDKLEGVERKAEKVREKMVPIFEHLFETQGEVTVESIMDNLRGGKMNDGTEFNGFARTSGETLYKTATAIFNMFNSYKNKLGSDDKAVIRRLSEDFANNLAREMRNKDIEKIVDEGLHLSGVNVGVSWSFARLFTGFFLSGGLTFTYYGDSEYKENKDMVRKAEEGMENPDNYEIITNGEKTYEAKMNIINDFLKGDYLKYRPEVIARNLEGTRTPAHIILSKEIFGKDLKVLCHPELAQYIIQEDGEIKLPGNADVSLAKIMHQGKAEYTLILGANSSNNCEAITLEDGKLKGKGSSKVEFGSKKDDFEKYNTEIRTKIESMSVGLDGKPNDNLVNYLVLPEGSNALVNFRLTGNWKAFNKFIQDNPERGGDTEEGQKEFVNKAKSYLSESLQNIKDKQGKPVDMEFTVDDIRFIYASLSRVSQTRDKQLEGEDLKTKANEYLSKLHLSSENKALLEGYISKVEGGASLSDDEWSKMKGILNINYDNWEYKTSISNAEKLFHILTPVKKLADHRTRSYERRINSEYSSLGGGADVLIAARNESLKKLEGKPTANGSLQKGWIGAVAGYDDRRSITDKFVSSPKIISGSEVIIPESENLKLVKRHFLDELSRDDAAQFKYIKERIISTLEKSTKKEDNEVAQRWQTLADAEFIDAILSETTKDAEGKDVLRVSFNMQYGFFADCVNEAILLGDINVVTTTEEKIQAPHDVHYYDAVVTNDAVTTAHSISIGATFGKVDTKKPEKPTPPEDEPEPKDNTEPEAPKDKTVPFSDCDGLSEIEGISSVDFDCQEFTYNGVTYSYYFEEIDGEVCMIAYDPTVVDGPDLIVQKIEGANGTVTLNLVERDSFHGWNLPDNATEVGVPPVEGGNDDFKQRHEEWEKRHEDYLKKMKIYEKDEAKYLEDCGKLAKYTSESVRGLSMHLMYLNFLMRHSTSQERNGLLNQINSTKKQIRTLLVDKIVGSN